MKMGGVKYLVAAALLSATALYGKKPVECRVIVGEMRECSPYSMRLLKAKEIRYTPSKKRLIVEKTLPVPPKQKHMEVISVEDMIERYIKVEPPKRFSGTEEKVYISIPKPRKKPKDSVEDNRTEEIGETKEENLTIPQPSEKPIPKIEEIPTPEGIYKVQAGDTLSKIALMFGMKLKVLMDRNGLKKKDTLKIGQKLKLPIDQEKIDAIAKGVYKVKQGDTLISIAKAFGLDPKALAKYNKMRDHARLRAGKTLKLPLPYILAAKERKKKMYGSKGFGTHRLRVTATAYTSHGKQTDSTPFLAAWNNRLRPGMKVIAVSRDLLYKYGMKNGTRVKISGLPGIYRVRDKMNKRYKKRIDIYMGLDRRRALRWGRRSVVIYW